VGVGGRLLSLFILFGGLCRTGADRWTVLMP